MRREVFELCLERRHVVSCAGLCRDPADEMVLGLVVPGRVDVIVCGDKDLLVLKKFETARTVTPREFRESARDETR